MQKKRLLVIIIRENFLHFILAGLSEGEIVPLNRHKVRIFDQTFDFSICDYILNGLEIWGKDIGINIVNEMIPNMGGEDVDGIDELFILSYKKFEGLKDITPHIFYFGDKNTPEGAKNIVDFLDFSNLIYYSVNEDKISLTKYSRTKKTSVKVTTYYKEFHEEDYSDDIKYILKFFSEYQSDFASKQLDQMLNKKSRPYKLSKDSDVNIEYFLIKIRRYLDLIKNKKLDLKDFGAGVMKDNILVVGGDSPVVESNISLEIFSIVCALGLKGNFKIYVDNYGIFDFLQKGKDQVFSDLFIYKFLFKFWGNYIKISYDGNSFDYEEVLADADLIQKGSEKQIIPMLGKVMKIEVDEKANLRLNLFDKSFIANKSGKVEYNEIENDIILDSTGISKLDRTSKKKKKLIERYINWLKNIKAIN